MASISGLPCSNSPNDEQCTHTRGAGSRWQLKAIWSITWCLPLTHNAAFLLNSESTLAITGYNLINKKYNNLPKVSYLKTNLKMKNKNNLKMC
jgi:hypothetical protein